MTSKIRPKFTVGASGFWFKDWVGAFCPAGTRGGEMLSEHVEAGRTIICTEPTATLMLREHYRDIVPGDEARILVSASLRRFAGAQRAAVGKTALARVLARNRRHVRLGKGKAV